ncbi:MAG: hypothetical protein HETSPECPRED_006801 [Heterodermia speciosa]|uniref:DH domain-containing protein n=1 Tax=Heterodermia speciosa TaxID=116794 RepID=A0A8H3IR08_9LECA|nr:MAG: hypothetical protein HETSPECPRED_006801 [Heterodermia speciosa]
MVMITPALPALSPDIVSLYYTKDALLENLPIVIFYGPSVTANSTHNSSRIQAHVYSLAGFQSFARLTIAPTSPVYAAVHHLPTEKQGDEVYRGLAVGLLSYFAGIPKATKEALKDLVARRRPNRLAPAMFDEMHAGDLAARMIKVDDSKDCIAYTMSALSSQIISWVDMDVVLPPGTIERVMSTQEGDQAPSIDDNGLPLYQYGDLTALISSLGSPTFLPSSKLKRAPSRPTAHSKNKSLTKDQKISLRREMCEMLDTEKRYVDKIYEVVHVMAKDFAASSQSADAVKIVERLFPESLARILAASTAFHDEIEKVLEETEDDAIKDIEVASATECSGLATKSSRRDPTGTTTFAKTLLQWFPKFTNPYQDYMRSSADLSEILAEAYQVEALISAKIQEMGEQRLRSALIEPIQRLPRYSLLIENMVALLPASHPALASLLKAKDVVTDICALDTGGSNDSTRAVACLRSLVKDWPPACSPHGRLVTAADVVELEPPYLETPKGKACVMVLFPEACILLRKDTASALSARGVIAEIERPAIRLNARADEAAKSLTFSCELPLSALHISHSEDGRLMWLRCSAPSPSNLSSLPSTGYTKVIALLSSYERKAARLSEEIARSRIEGRHAESLRDSDKWTLRTVDHLTAGLGVLAAIFEDSGPNGDHATQPTSNIKLVIGSSTSTKSILAADSHVDTAICVTFLENSMYRVDCRPVNGSASTDTTTAENFSELLLKNCRWIYVVDRNPS